MAKLTLVQKKDLRAWHKKQLTKPSLKQTAAYALRELNVKVHQSQISRLLSNKFEALDTLEASYLCGKASKLRVGQYSTLEEILYRWQVEMESRGVPTTGEVLQAQAVKIWSTVEAARNGLPIDPPPTFGSKWLTLFKERHTIKRRIFHGELSSAQQDAGVEAQMEAIRIAAADTPVGNRYNMDQTGLFWRMFPSSGLSTANRPGLKKDKARISLAFTTNDTGTDRFELWAIGKAKEPRALKKFNFGAHKVIWRSNQKAWFTTVIMEEWYRSFFTHIQQTKPGQKVLLLLDNFSAHKKALDNYPPPEGITVLFIPPNNTARWQPLDQGIISAWKRLYRKAFLSWIVESMGSGSTDFHPVNDMNLRLALPWAAWAWFGQVKDSTIEACWKKSTVIGLWPTVQTPPDLSDGVVEIYSLFTQAAEALRVVDRSAMAINRFLNPEEEEEAVEAPAPEEILAVVVDEVVGGPELTPDLSPTPDNDGVANLTEPDTEDEEECYYALPSIVSLKEAICHVRDLLDIADEKANLMDFEDVRALQRIKRKLEGVVVESREQKTLDNWLAL